MTFYVIPTEPQLNQQFTASLNGNNVQLLLRWCEADDGGWFMDIMDSAGTSLACGIRLTPGLDLLQPYGYLGLGVSMYVLNSSDVNADPTWEDLGVNSLLYAEW